MLEERDWCDLHAYRYDVIDKSNWNISMVLKKLWMLKVSHVIVDVMVVVA